MSSHIYERLNFLSVLSIMSSFDSILVWIDIRDAHGSDRLILDFSFDFLLS